MQEAENYKAQTVEKRKVTQLAKYLIDVLSWQAANVFRQNWREQVRWASPTPGCLGWIGPLARKVRAMEYKIEIFERRLNMEAELAGLAESATVTGIGLHGENPQGLDQEWRLC